MVFTYQSAVQGMDIYAHAHMHTCNYNTYKRLIRSTSCGRL